MSKTYLRLDLACTRREQSEVGRNRVHRGPHNVCCGNEERVIDCGHWHQKTLAIACSVYFGMKRIHYHPRQLGGMKYPNGWAVNAQNDSLP